MRMIGTIPRAEDAERFSDYLVAQKIENMVEESQQGGAWSVWVEKDDEIDRGKSELTAFLANPADPKYDAAGRTAERLRREQEKQEKRRRTNFVDVRTKWAQPRQWARPVTLTLLVISIIVSIATGLGAKMDPIGRALLIEDAPRTAPRAVPSSPEAPRVIRQRPVQRDVLSNVRRGQVWRLITPIFLHFSILHLLFNMFWLRDLGGMIESQRGTWVMLALALATALVGNLSQYFWSSAGFGGMSGVVYGLFGYVWIKQRFEPQLGLGLNSQSTMIIIAWLFISMTGFVGPIANAAHVGGLLSGAAFAFAPFAWRRAKRQWGG